MESCFHTLCNPIIVGCKLYTTNTATAFVADGYYSDGTNCYHVVSGVVTSIVPCTTGTYTYQPFGYASRWYNDVTTSPDGSSVIAAAVQEAVQGGTGGLYESINEGALVLETGTFGPLWQHITTNMTTGDIFATKAGSGIIYKQTGGVGAYDPYVTLPNIFIDGLSCSNNNLYAINSAGGSDPTNILKQTNMTGSFNQIYSTAGAMRILHCAPNNDIYYHAPNETPKKLYKQTGGVGPFVGIYDINNVNGITVTPSGDLYFTNTYNVYKQVGGGGPLNIDFTSVNPVYGIHSNQAGKIYFVTNRISSFVGDVWRQVYS